MLRLLFALVVIGITPPGVEPSSVPQAQPVPKPEVTGKGVGEVTVFLYTYIKYEACNDYSACMRFFNETKISEYSKPIGDLNHMNIGKIMDSGLLEYAFTLENADCKKVKLWMDQIVPSSSVYQSANVVCPDMPTPPHLKIEPVPKPKGHLIGKGSDLVSVEIYTSVKHFNGDTDYLYAYFDKTKIREYSELLGEFGHSLGWRNVEYHYVAYNFEIKKTICKKVLLWLQEVVNSSSFFKKFVTTGKNGLDCNYSMPAYHQHKHHRLE